MLGSYGLRNKRELWKAQTRLSTIRKQARTLLAATEEVRLREEKILLDSLKRRGLVAETAGLDDILSMTVEDVLNRRLQTMVFKKGMALSALHSRQLITHGHVAVGKRRIMAPSYPVGREEEATIAIVGIKEKPPAEPEAAPLPAPEAASEAGPEPTAEKAAPAE